MLMQIIRSAADTFREWWDVFRASRKKPSPFIVHVLEQKHFFCSLEYFNKHFKKSCSFPIRPVRELWFVVNNPKRNSKANLMARTMGASYAFKQKKLPAVFKNFNFAHSSLANQQEI